MGYRTYDCPIARDCRGCELLSVPYPIQLRRKAERVRELLGEMAESDGATIAEVAGMEEPTGFRHKAATPLVAGSRGKVLSGFYAAGSTRVVPASACLAEAPAARPVLESVARGCERLRIPTYRRRDASGIVRYAVARCGWATDELLLTIVTNGRELPHAKQLADELMRAHPEITSIVQNVNTSRTSAMLGRECHTLAGPGHMRDGLLGCTFEIGPTAFYQTNPQQTEVLYQLAIDAAGLEGGMRMLDAYCGTGTIGICAAAATPGVEVVGVEKGHGAVACARRNAEANKVAERCEFVQADATSHLAALARRKGGKGSFDVVVLDPPRAGSTPEFLSAAAAIAPERIVYVSCEPTTLARDVAVLRRLGYQLRAVEPVDMFPHSKHIEVVAGLERR